MQVDINRFQLVITHSLTLLLSFPSPTPASSPTPSPFPCISARTLSPLITTQVAQDPAVFFFFFAHAQKSFSVCLKLRHGQAQVIADAHINSQHKANSERR